IQVMNDQPHMLRTDPLSAVAAPWDKTRLASCRSHQQHGDYSPVYLPRGYLLDNRVRDSDSVSGSGRVVDQVPGEKFISCVIADDAPLRHLVFLVFDHPLQGGDEFPGL